jgi:Zn-dependent protease
MSLLLLIQQSPVLAIVFLFSLILAVTVHEFAHAWAADKLGDDTPRLMGRVTLNPLAHLDPIGSLTFILFGFGWGKPVLYNSMRLSRKIDELWIALAGPISNLILATLLNVLSFAATHYGLTFFNAEILGFAADINILLAAFNMIPVAPLDGSSIVAFFWPEYRSVMGAQIGLVILLLLIVTGYLGVIVTPVQTLFSHITHLFGILG